MHSHRKPVGPVQVSSDATCEHAEGDSFSSSAHADRLVSEPDRVTTGPIGGGSPGNGGGDRGVVTGGVGHPRIEAERVGHPPIGGGNPGIIPKAVNRLLQNLRIFTSRGLEHGASAVSSVAERMRRGAKALRA